MKFLAFVITLCCTVSLGWAVTFDFEDMSTVTDLTDAGWEIDDGGSLTDTIVIETTIVKNGSKALRIGLRDWVSFDTGGDYGTLDLWVYDNGYLNSDYYDTAYGPTWGLQKDLTGSWTYPGSTAAYDYVYPYGMGVGLVEKSFLPGNAGYAEAHGQDLPMPQLLQDIVDQDVIDGDPLTFTEQEILDTRDILHYGWGRQSWFSPAFFGGASPNNGWERVEGWCHYQIQYLEDGLVEIYMLENGDASASPSAVYDIDDPAMTASLGAFDGSYGGGVSRLFVWGGSTDDTIGGNIFGDTIIDDVIWTPAGTPPCPGDIDKDGDVDIFDFLVLKANYGTPSGATWEMGDLDDDEDVDIFDFLVLKANYGNICQ